MRATAQPANAANPGVAGTGAAAGAAGVGDEDDGDGNVERERKVQCCENRKEYLLYYPFATGTYHLSHKLLPRHSRTLARAFFYSCFTCPLRKKSISIVRLSSIVAREATQCFVHYITRLAAKKRRTRRNGTQLRRS